jgi:hypothetical protein
VSFTVLYKHALTVKATRVIRRREDFLDTLDGEARSLETARADLSAVFDAPDTTIIPE